MEPTERDPGAALSPDLTTALEQAAARLEAARRRGFYPVMLLLERLVPGGTKLGHAAAVHEEGLRFRHDPSLSFTPTEVVEIKGRELPPDPSDWSGNPRQVAEVTTSFLGLTGTVSPLPPFVAEEVAQDDSERPARREFLDLFHHRMLSLFHRALAKGDAPGTYHSDQSDPWSHRALALLGFDAQVPGLAAKWPLWRLLRLAPLLAEPMVTASALEVAIADVLREALGGAAVHVEQYADQWVDIPAEDRTRLGVAATQLGSTAVLGQRMFDRAGKVRVVLGPVDRDGYQRLALRPEALAEVKALIAILSSGELEHEVILALEPEAAPPARLSSEGVARLGRSAFLGKQSRAARLKLEA